MSSDSLFLLRMFYWKTLSLMSYLKFVTSCCHMLRWVHKGYRQSVMYWRDEMMVFTRTQFVSCGWRDIIEEALFFVWDKASILLQFTIMHHSYKSKTHCYKYINFLCKKKYYLHILLELLAECCVTSIFHRYAGRTCYITTFNVSRTVWCIYEIHGKDWFLCRGTNISKFF